MISELRIHDLGVIDDASIELVPGFTVVTGETGAGKTMIVTGIGLLLGYRADPGAIRRGAARARVEGIFSGVAPETATKVRDIGGDLDGSDLLITRQVAPSRSRSFIGGAGVPAGTAAQISADLVTIHGQSEQIRLVTAERQRELLDTAAGPQLTALLTEYAAAWAERAAARRELVELRTNARERAREIDLLTFGLDEIAAVEPQPGEDVELAAEADRLQAVDDLRLAAYTAVTALVGGDEDMDAVSALSTAAAARRALQDGAEADQSLTEHSRRAAEITVLVQELAGDLSSYLSDLEADPHRLEWIAERRSALQGLTRKYGETVDDVLAWSQSAAERLGGLASGDDRIGELESRVAALDETLAERATTITGLRHKAAERLEEAVRDELAALAMPHARLQFAITPLPELGPQGADQIVLEFTANPGSEPRPLAKVASGGELSRVRLALEVVLADDHRAGTFVFDEVDSGVGGRVAVEIGRRLAALARHSQVIVVTHLAQVAAFADRHLVVQKSSDGQVTTSGVHVLSTSERAEELARMMAGLETSESALAHARELLTEAGHG